MLKYLEEHFDYFFCILHMHTKSGREFFMCEFGPAVFLTFLKCSYKLGSTEASRIQEPTFVHTN